MDSVKYDEVEPGFDKDTRREEFTRKRKSEREHRGSEQRVPGAFRRKTSSVDNSRWEEDWEDELYEDEMEISNIWDDGD